VSYPNFVYIIEQAGYYVCATGNPTPNRHWDYAVIKNDCEEDGDVGMGRTPELAAISAIESGWLEGE